LQYVGPLQDGPAVVSTTVLPDVGIAYPHNWCQAMGLLYMVVAKAGLVRMRGDGSLDYEWGAPIRDAVKGWTLDQTIIGFHPDTMSVVVMNNGTGYSFSLQNEMWSPMCRFVDAGVSGSALACTTSQGDLVVTVNNASTHMAYAWDTGAATMPITSFTNWKRAPGRPVHVLELLASFECDRTADPIFISAHRNLRKTFCEDAQVTNGSNVLTSASFAFDAAHSGDMALVQGANVGGAGVNYLLARITYASATTVQMSDPVTGAPLNAQATVTGCYCIVAHTIRSFTLTRTGPQHLPPLLNFMMKDCLTHAFGVNMVTAAGQGQVFTLAALGTGQGSQTSQTT
jgi:hypothetical protein